MSMGMGTPEPWGHPANQGEVLRDKGTEQAGSGLPVASLVSWEQKARAAIAELIKVESNFTADDVRKIAGDPPTPNAMGAALRLACKRYWIRPVGVTTADRPSRHASLLRVWSRA